MKKILLFFAACMMILATSCGGNGDAKAVYEKIENHQELSQDDYTVMIKYVDEALSSGLLMDDKEMSDQDMDEFIKKTDEWKKKYEYLQEFIGEIGDGSKLDDKNKKLFEELNNKLL